jgi:hypothetical protein
MSCLYCKAMDHEVLDFPRMIAKLERINLNEGHPKEEPHKESEKVLMKMQETLNDHRDLSLLEIFKKKE